MEILLFKTEQFNLSKEYEHFINPGCYGEDLANWLKPKLESTDIVIDRIYQEDWGWEISCKENKRGYYLGVSGIQEKEDSNYGEWRIIVTKRRSLWENICGQNKLSKNENIIAKIQDILHKTNFSDIKFE